MESGNIDKLELFKREMIAYVNKYAHIFLYRMAIHKLMKEKPDTKLIEVSKKIKFEDIVVPEFKIDFINPMDINYRDLSETEQQDDRFIINPETCSLDFDNRRLKIVGDDTEMDENGNFSERPMWEFIEYVKRKYGNNHIIPGLEFIKYLESLCPEYTDGKLPKELTEPHKDGSFFHRNGGRQNALVGSPLLLNGELFVQSINLYGGVAPAFHTIRNNSYSRIVLIER